MTLELNESERRYLLKIVNKHVRKISLSSKTTEKSLITGFNMQDKLKK